MKRAPFLGAASAVLLAGCGGHHVMRALPGVAPSSTSSSKNYSQHGKLVPDVAEAIPDSVLTHPIIGEARRFDGAAAPPGWMLAQGQALPTASNHALFSVIGKIGGGDATTFKLPNPGFGVIIAVAGLLPTSPDVLAQSGRRMTHAGSAVAGASMPLPHDPHKTATDRSIAARRALSSLAVRVGRPSPPVPRELVNRMRQTRFDAGAEALAALSSGSRARLDAGIQAAMAGRTDVYGAVTEMAATLTNGEADALLQINAAMIRAYNDRWDGNPRPNVKLDAANFLLSVAITADQANAIAAHES